MQIKRFDVIIAGGGPAGCATALGLAQAGLSVAILDKANFPRDKICGDALSVDVLNQLPKLSDTLAQKFTDFPQKTASFGVRLYSPGCQHIDIPFLHKGKESSGYICQRIHFDNLLFEQIKQHTPTKVFEQCLIENIDNTSDEVLLNTSQGLFAAHMLVGADGAQSVVGRQLGHTKVDRAHYSAGLRVYYTDVAGFHRQNFIELYFFQDILPGYLWVFPLPRNRANVGIGMLSSAISRKQVNLKEVLHKLLHTHPQLKERFNHAQALESYKGFGLPLGSKKRAISGKGYLLTGDAASLIDPFTGEGIGNAIRSGRVAAEHIISCFKQHDFSASFNKAYDLEIYNRMWKELKLSRTLQQLCAYPWLFNFLMKKAHHNAYLQHFFTEALADVDTKNMLTKPSFYYRLFFNKS